MECDVCNVDISYKNDILDSDEKIFGIIYEITNTMNNMKYVGQTHSHRKNHKKYRPFGLEGRFKSHMSSALKNTSKSQSSYLANAIRKYGKDVFTVRLVEYCSKETIDSREQHFIKICNTLYPSGYNLTIGGKAARHVSNPYSDKSQLNEPGKRGGCISRSEETRARMSQRGKESSTDDVKLARSISTKNQHYSAKLERFKDCEIDLSIIDSYIRKKGKKIRVMIDGKRAEFASKRETIEQLKERARAFIKEVKELNDATLSNCGEPIKHE